MTGKMMKPFLMLILALGFVVISRPLAAEEVGSSAQEGVAGENSELRAERDKLRRILSAMELSRDAYADGLGAVMEEVSAEADGIRDKIDGVRTGTENQVLLPGPTPEPELTAPVVAEEPEPLPAPEPVVEKNPELPPAPEPVVEKNPEPPPAPEPVVQKAPERPRWTFAAPEVPLYPGDRGEEEEKFSGAADEMVRDLVKHLNQRAGDMEKRYGLEDCLETVWKALKKRGVKNPAIYDASSEWGLSLMNVWTEIKTQIMYQPALDEIVRTGIQLKNKPALVPDHLEYLFAWRTLWDQTDERLADLFGQAVGRAADIASLDEKSLEAGENPKNGESGARQQASQALSELLDEILMTATARPSFEICTEQIGPSSSVEENDKERRYELKKALRKAGTADEEAIKAGQASVEISKMAKDLEKKYEKTRQKSDNAYRDFQTVQQMGGWGSPGSWQAYQEAEQEATQAEAEFRAHQAKQISVEQEVNRLRLEAKSAWENYRGWCRP
ncbi:MAG: hypothetical protein WC352_06550 [Candidatus Omnitrophota bacterium]|jgi:hypothetical protein